MRKGSLADKPGFFFAKQGVHSTAWLHAVRCSALTLWVAVPILSIVAQPLAGRFVWTVVIAGLPLFIVLVGYHRWRTICPLSWFNQVPARLGRAGRRRMPSRMEGSCYYIPLVAFTVGLWTRLIWINGDGRGIALFFIGLSILSLLFGAIMLGKSWCNYLCPVSFIEKIYAEPCGLWRTENSECRPCTACKNTCPDINLEKTYWREIDLGSKRVAYFAYPGLVLGFYSYYFLQAGTWDYYFGGMSLDEPGLVWHAFAPGYNAATAGFFFAPWVPRAAAAFLTLTGCATVSCAVFSWCVVPLTGCWLARGQITMDRRNAALSVAAFTAFVTFYAFGWETTLRRADWVLAVAEMLTFCLAVVLLVHRLRCQQPARSSRSWRNPTYPRARRVT